jgi:hypothetical protein
MAIQCRFIKKEAHWINAPFDFAANDSQTERSRIPISQLNDIEYQFFKISPH